ncbi:hypothetical protein JK232_01650 [Nissabacter archeti]|uniref:Uncharacterized protein n=1 Tax=Nissabacter archeti TaxID=1917880 RepID=A0ABS5JCM6_9GAMM|nr:hypothetical protein [Nissabacter archeti]MBS0967591.1 hypothetical protein [Nissabacter archeti]
MKIQYSTLTIEDASGESYPLKLTYSPEGDIEEIVFPNGNVIPADLRNPLVSYFQALGKKVSTPGEWTLTRIDITQFNAGLYSYRPRYDAQHRLTHFTDERDFPLIASEEESLIASLEKIPDHLPGAFQAQDVHALPEETPKKQPGENLAPKRGRG